MTIVTLAGKDLRLLLRDYRALVVLLLMPLVFIFVLGVSLGEGFGQKPEDRLKVSVVVLDEGPTRFLERPAILREGLAWLSLTPDRLCAGTEIAAIAGAIQLAEQNHRGWFPYEPWSELVLRDLGETADIKVELIGSLREAEELVRGGKRAAVLVLGKHFSQRVERCSFLAGGWQETFTLTASFPEPGNPVLLALAAAFNEKQRALPIYAIDGLNPFFRDGVKLGVLDVKVLRDPTQQTAAAIIDQVVQLTLIRVVMPWMIGRAFEKIADPQFLQLLLNDEQIPKLVRAFLSIAPASEKQALSAGLQGAIQNLFPKYNLTAKTWAALTKEAELSGAGADRVQFGGEGGGWLKRGSLRYQLLVPSYLVMFAFFLVLTVGWLFTAERREGTIIRLYLAPISTTQVLLGKLIPCLCISLFQGLFLLAAGRMIFGMSWGPEPAWLVLVVACTSLAAMGLALLIAVLAQTESQVSIYGTLVVLVLAGLSGCMMGDRSLMPEQMQSISRLTPHAWSLDAFRQLLVNPGAPSWSPNLAVVGQACAVLAGFGVGFLVLAWAGLKMRARF